MVEGAPNWLHQLMMYIIAALGRLPLTTAQIVDRCCDRFYELGIGPAEVYAAIYDLEDARSIVRADHGTIDENGAMTHFVWAHVDDVDPASGHIQDDALTHDSRWCYYLNTRIADEVDTHEEE